MTTFVSVLDPSVVGGRGQSPHPRLA